jgi:[ribosomal protein S5]-alanine N-acetyltransferase
MTPTRIETKRLTLVLQSPDDVRAFLEGLQPEQRAEVSPAWLARLDSATAPDPWIHGFAIQHRATNATIGNVAFKGPPSPEGIVEIAYHIAPEHQCNGYATEAAGAATNFAFATGQVRTVRAHTRPEPNASGRVLTKCAYQFLGEAIEPDDGLVWRWEKSSEIP